MNKKATKKVVTPANLRQVHRRLERLETAVAKLKDKKKKTATPRKTTRKKKKPDFDQIPAAD